MREDPVATDPAAAATPLRRSIPHLRWWIAGLLAIATALNYLDRQSFPVVVNEVRKEIPISNEQYGQLTSLFLLAYAIMYAGGGRIMDWLGARTGYAVMIVWWSAANFCTGFVASVTGGTSGAGVTGVTGATRMIASVSMLMA